MKKAVEVEMRDHELATYLREKGWTGPEKGTVHYKTEGSSRCASMMKGGNGENLAYILYDNATCTRRVWVFTEDTK